MLDGRSGTDVLGVMFPGLEVSLSRKGRRAVREKRGLAEFQSTGTSAGGSYMSLVFGEREQKLHAGLP